eukprot:scaffold1906_cov403-Prasinococcus_capsulatus_cf.AAC.13
MLQTSHHCCAYTTSEHAFEGLSDSDMDDGSIFPYYYQEQQATVDEICNFQFLAVTPGAFRESHREAMLRCSTIQVHMEPETSEEGKDLRMNLDARVLREYWSPFLHIEQHYLQYKETQEVPASRYFSSMEKGGPQESIGRTVRSLLTEVLHPAAVLEYLRVLMKEYAAKQTFDPSDIRTMPGIEEAFDMYHLTHFKFQELQEGTRHIHSAH